MIRFELTDAVIRKVNLRAEYHGDETRPAYDVVTVGYAPGEVADALIYHPEGGKKPSEILWNVDGSPRLTDLKALKIAKKVENIDAAFGRNEKDAEACKLPRATLKGVTLNPCANGLLEFKATVQCAPEDEFADILHSLMLFDGGGLTVVFEERQLSIAASQAA